MSTDEYVPSEDDERIAHAYAEVIYHGSEGMVSREEGVAEFYAYLAAHDARVRRDAKAEAWDETCEAFAWCITNGPIEDALPYVAEHNPYRTTDVEKEN